MEKERRDAAPSNENETPQDAAVTKRKERGFSLKHMTGIMAAATITVSIVLLVCVFFIFNAFTGLRRVSEDYIRWEQAAHDMQAASDYLTEEARTFAETGDRTYLDNYFREANETKRRENALEVIHDIFPDSPTYVALSNAMDKSVELMNREYYSMHLTVLSHGLDMAAFPREIREVVLSAEDAALSADGKAARAREILFDAVYNDAKTNISRGTAQCLDSLNEEMETAMDANSGNLNTAIIVSFVFIFLSICVAVAMVAVTSLQVFNPLIRSIRHIKEDDPIPIQGAYEFRVLAETYNTMREINRRSKDRLKYEVDHDSLTGVLNRRGFEQLHDRVQSERLALMIVDIDNFKHVNDSFGHLVGDQIIISVVGILKNYFGEDMICRMGGDEFVIVLEDVGAEGKQSIRDAIDNINRQLLQMSGELPAVTLSVGVAFGTALENNLYLAADDALYHTKQSGKCGVTFCE